MGFDRAIGRTFSIKIDAELSWIHGYYGLRDDDIRARAVRSRATEVSASWRDDRFFVAAGGKSPTLLSRLPNDGEAGTGGWIVAGLPMRLEAGRLAFVDVSDWHRILSMPNPDVTGLDGHFCAVKWGEDGVKMFNDALGLRTIYLAQRGRSTFFSTRLEWLAETLGDCVWDFEALGAQWFGRAELGTRTALAGVRRMGPGSSVTLSEHQFDVHDRPFSIRPEAALDSREALLAVTNVHVPGFTRTLACSGGLDSRVQLAGLLQHNSEVHIHNYGPLDHPDAAVSARIAERAGLALRRIPTLSNEPGISEVQAFSVATHAYAQASNMADWAHYASFRDEGRIVLDGSLGEIGRCFFYRGLRKARGATADGLPTTEAVATTQRHVRPDVFSGPVHTLMTSGHLRAVERVLSGLPSGIHADDLADLLMLRLEGPRYAGYATAAIDHIGVGFFPFAQPTLLRSLLAVPPGRRSAGLHYRELIRDLAPSLTQVPLVRNGPLVTVVPFGLSGRTASIFSLVARTIGRAWIDRRPQEFLAKLESPIRALVRSDATRHFEGYDETKLARFVDGYFEGQHDDATGVDRWLSFELWRLGVMNRSV